MNWLALALGLFIPLPVIILDFLDINPVFITVFYGARMALNCCLEAIHPNIVGYTEVLERTNIIKGWLAKFGGVLAGMILYYQIPTLPISLALPLCLLGFCTLYPKKYITKILPGAVCYMIFIKIALELVATITDYSTQVIFLLLFLSISPKEWDFPRRRLGVTNIYSSLGGTVFIQMIAGVNASLVTKLLGCPSWVAGFGQGFMETYNLRAIAEGRLTSRTSLASLVPEGNPLILCLAFACSSIFIPWYLKVCLKYHKVIQYITLGCQCVALVWLIGWWTPVAITIAVGVKMIVPKSFKPLTITAFTLA